jgi:peptidoglycan/LPS O-acetylase OafA/YrhL
VTYRSEIDGLRAFAVLVVIFYHTGTPGFHNGFLGVDIFFVISGYLITNLIMVDLEKNTFSIRRFYERRARRLLPALLLVCTTSFAAAWVIMPPPIFVDFAGHIIGAILFTANFIYWSQSGYFATQSDVLPLVHTWSLAVEEQYYLLYPVAMLLLWRLPSFWRLPTLFATGFLSFGLAIYLTKQAPEASFYLLPTRLWELVAGGVIASLQRDERIPAIPRWADHLAICGIASCLAALATPLAKATHPGWWTLLPVLGTSTFLAFARADRGVGALLSRPAIVGLGLVSYSLYLIHQPVLAFARIWLARPLWAGETALAVAASIIAAYWSWRIVEQPARRAEAIGFRPFIGLVAAAFAALFAGSSAVVATAGFPFRMDPQIAQVLEQVRSNPERLAGIYLHRCHWNAQSPAIEIFLARWNCLEEIGGSRPRILVVGDSIASDKAWVMREAGFPVANLGGAGCPVRPHPGHPPDSACVQIVRWAFDLAQRKVVDGIVLANAWTSPLSAEEQLEILKYWQPAGVPILIVSGMPSFDDLRDRIARHIREGRPLEEITHNRQAFDLHLASLSVFRAAGLPVLNSRDLLCGTGACAAFSGREPLMNDPIHLKGGGARRMAANLSIDPTWREWIGRLTADLETTGR